MSVHIYRHVNILIYVTIQETQHTHAHTQTHCYFVRNENVEDLYTTEK